jgi:hypothetical protein
VFDLRAHGLDAGAVDRDAAFLETVQAEHLDAGNGKEVPDDVAGPAGDHPDERVPLGESPKEARDRRQGARQLGPSDDVGQRPVEVQEDACRRRETPKRLERLRIERLGRRRAQGAVAVAA